MPTPVITCIDDLKQLHRRRVPKMFYDYAESGSYTEQTFRENTTDFARIRLRQKVAVDMTGRTTTATMIGHRVAMPVALAPVGMTGMQCADGEIKAARAAEAFGVPYTLSTMSVCSIEDVAAHTTQPFWFQLYVMRDEDFVANMIERAQRAKCSALVLTLDLQILGQRHKDLKNDLTAPPRLTLKNLVNIATKPGWALGMLGTKRRSFGNIVGHAKGVGDLSSLMSWTSEQFDPQLDWDKIAKIRDQWGGEADPQGDLGSGRCPPRRRFWCRCNYRFKPWWPSVGWGCQFDHHVAVDFARRGRQDRGLARQWYPLGPRCDEGDGYGGQGHDDRAFIYLWAGCDGAGGCDPRAGGDAKRNGHHDGAVWCNNR